jgi:hypothetical protein
VPLLLLVEVPAGQWKVTCLLAGPQQGFANLDTNLGFSWQSAAV